MNSFFQRYFTREQRLGFLYWRDRLAIPVVLIVAFGAAVVALLLLISDRQKFDHIGFYPASVIGTLMLQTDRPPARLKMEIKLADGTKLQVIARGVENFSMAGDKICVSLFRHPRRDTQIVRIAALRKCVLESPN